MAKNFVVSVTLRALDSLSPNLRKIGAGFLAMGRDSRLAAGQVKSAQLALKQTGDRIRAFGEQLNVFGTGGKIALGLLGYQMIRTAEQFDEGMDKLQLKMGLLNGTGGKMREMVRQFATDTSMAADQIALMAAELAVVKTLRDSPEQLMKVVEQANLLRQVVGTDYATAGEIVAKFGKAFNLSAGQMGEAANAIGLAVSQGLEFDEVSGMLKTGALNAAAFGASYEEVLALFLKFQQAGMMPRASATAMQELVGTLSGISAGRKPTDEFIVGMTTLGIRAKDLKGIKLPGFLELLGRKFELLRKKGVDPVSIATQIFGETMGPALVGVLNTANGTLAETAKGLQKQGFIAAAAKELNDDYTGSMERLKDSLTNLQLAMMEDTGAATLMGNALEGLNNQVKGLSNTSKTLLVVFGGIAVVLTTLSAAVAGGAWIFSTLLPAVLKIGRAFAWLGRGLLLIGQIASWIGGAIGGTVLAAIGLVAAALYLWITRWDQIKEGFKTITASWESFREVLHGAWLTFLDLIDQVLLKLDKLGKWLSEKAKGFAEFFEGIGDRLNERLSGASAVGGLLPGFAPITPALSLASAGAAGASGMVGVNINVTAAGGATARVTDVSSRGNVKPTTRNAGAVGGGRL